MPVLMERPAGYASDAALKARFNMLLDEAGNIAALDQRYWELEAEIAWRLWRAGQGDTEALAALSGLVLERHRIGNEINARNDAWWILGDYRDSIAERVERAEALLAKWR